MKFLSKIKNDYVSYWKNWRHFSGRTSRLSFWTPVIINMFLSGIISGIISFFTSIDLYVFLFQLIFGLILITPNIAVTMRRLRDGGSSPKWAYGLLMGIPTLFVPDKMLQYLIVVDPTIKIITTIMMIVSFIYLAIMIVLLFQRSED